LKYSKLEIHINYQDENFFVEDSDIRKIISNLGYAVNQSLKEVDLNRIEEILRNNSSISVAEVYSTIDGRLMVEVTQRRPIIRVFNKLGNSYYIDDEGELMPTSDKYTSRVLVASGNIENNITTYAIERTLGSSETIPNEGMDMLEQIYQLARTIDSDEFWKAQIVQIYVNEEMDIELIARVGQHKIILGDIEDLDIKLKKLKMFYDKGLSKTGWNEYSIINLKFKDQIVCTKRYI
jgi:cell division protein FtsQ